MLPVAVFIEKTGREMELRRQLRAKTGWLSPTLGDPFLGCANGALGVAQGSWDGLDHAESGSLVGTDAARLQATKAISGRPLISHENPLTLYHFLPVR